MLLIEYNSSIIFIDMAKVQHYIPTLQSKFICSKGGAHAQEPLNLVCLDPLCRNDPLGCSVCFIQTHKHHRVISVDKFIDDYHSNVRQVKQSKTLLKIKKYHSTVQDLIVKIRQEFNQKLDNFEESIDSYADQLRAKTKMRNFVSQSLGIPLDPQKVKQSKNNQEFREVLKFILNNSLFDQNKNMIRVSDILKQDEDRIFALLDKMSNMTQHCQAYIRQTLKSLHFSVQTVKKQKIWQEQQLDKMKLNQDQFDADSFKQKQTLSQTIFQNISLHKPHWHQAMYLAETRETIPPNTQDALLQFSQKNKHSMIQIKDKCQVGVSNITALKPQYALLTPHLTTSPAQVKEWTIKVKSCRNFASQNTMGIGLATKPGLSSCNFQGPCPKSAILLTSQGYLFEKGESRKTNLIFGSGDLLECRYDPFYRLLEISKENGRKLSLSVNLPEKEELFACVRLTYASDQIQIL